MPVRFSAGALRVAGLARFLVLDAGELPVLYAAPVETSPEAPWVPLADPPEFAATLARRYGRCPTLGTPGDLHALAAGILPEEAYLGDLADDFAARAAIVLGEIDRGGFDLFVAFVPLVERVALGLERLADREHPRYDEERALAAAPGFGGVRLRDAVLAAYAYLDDLVGRVAGRLGPDDVLLLVSDHGLRPWRRAVHLNAWLRREGLLVLGAQEATGRPIWEGETPGLDDVDWTRTQAYAVGRGGIYVNLRGRESRGTVDPGERYDRLVERLAFKLGNWTDDGAGGAAVVRRVLVRGRDFRGRREEALPDLLVALADGYAASAETEAGLVPEAEVAPNASLIGADHDSADAADVPGLLFSTRPFGRGDATIVDVGATVLGFFGLRDAGGGRGRDLWGP
jgi:predicted AlkP superfamily phosphohydrolase/phosphomutase